MRLRFMEPWKAGGRCYVVGEVVSAASLPEPTVVDLIAHRIVKELPGYTEQDRMIRRAPVTKD